MLQPKDLQCLVIVLLGEKCSFTLEIYPYLHKYTAPRKGSKDTLVSFEEKVNKILLDLKKTGKITDKLYHRLHLTGSQPPRLYDLRKNHKKILL